MTGSGWPGHRGGWICQARSAGLLTQVGQGTRTARNRRALAVATAPGLDDDVLIEAVREHADGTLRVGRHAARGPGAAGVAEDAPRAAQPGGVTRAAAASRCAPASGRH